MFKNLPEAYKFTTFVHMSKDLTGFLGKTRLSKEEINERLRHPITRVKYPARTMFVLLKKYVEDFFHQGAEPHMLCLAGLRGTGKTTLLWHTAEHIYQHITEEVFFFNVNILNDLGISLSEALEAFQTQVLKTTFRKCEKRLVLLFDEIQDDPHWSRTLKILYDEAPNVFVLCTGSSALLLNQSADLARRMRTERLFPFKFTEFLLAQTSMEQLTLVYPPSGLARELKEALFFSPTAEDLIWRARQPHP